MNPTIEVFGEHIAYSFNVAVSYMGYATYYPTGGNAGDNITLFVDPTEPHSDHFLAVYQMINAMNPKDYSTLVNSVLELEQLGYLESLKKFIRRFFQDPTIETIDADPIKFITNNTFPIIREYARSRI